ncbi:hypothetical protein [Streptomyces caniscabiei]|uniref:Uncharacterized protein n=1 Tax=Streptomyces caniscabiei TaxID=2746961 RepID=A0A927L1Z8_9ACTN|nr:hypothetical protein [Streptomyces caniscabiei]MBD9723501.1 hypothetical protein [Streptomyces caniscabiei]MDX3721065.1 hypothetical protein [Streptomyces caniscabiei]WEO27072.1 hypothetical protein IHE65_30095 [Streptomyces caniscabiei]
MTNPKHAQDTPMGRYYQDPAGGPDLVSVTNVIDTAVNKSMALVPWGVKLTVEHVLDNVVDIARRVLLDRLSLTREIKAIHREVRERAADLGDRVHAAAEARLLGAPIADDPEVAPYLAQFDLWLKSWGVVDDDVEATEITVLHRRLGYAGTADLMVWLPSGPDGRRELWLIDYKSSATRPAKSVYPENTLQLAALRYAETALLPDDTEEPMPRIERTGVLNLRARSHALVPMPAGRDAHRAFRGALETTRWLHAAKSSYPALTAPEGVTRPIRKAA